MFKSIKFTGALALTMLGMVSGQAQDQPYFSRDMCVKVRDGKSAEYSVFMRDVITKLAKVRVESGMFSSFLAAQAVEPAGRSARCDYHFVYSSLGFPSELANAEQTTADLKKAGINMTGEQMFAKREELSYLVGMDLWRVREVTGIGQKGGYGRLNYYKTKPSASLADWTRLEATGWKPLAQELAKEAGFSWVALTLTMPGGESLPYNALTVDYFPSWAALGKGVQTRALWNKVHPEMDFAAYIDHVNALVERPRIDIVKFVEVIGGGKSAKATGAE